MLAALSCRSAIGGIARMPTLAAFGILGWLSDARFVRHIIDIVETDLATDGIGFGNARKHIASDSREGSERTAARHSNLCVFLEYLLPSDCYY